MGEEAGETSEKYWKPKVLKLREQSSRLFVFVLDLHEAELITSEDLKRVFGRFDEIAIFQSGLPELTFDALGYGLMRNAIHQAREKLLEIYPDCKTKLDRQLGNDRPR